MDAYEKWFVKAEAKRKLAETEEAEKALNNKTEEIKKSPDKIEVEKKLTDETKDEIKPTINTEEKIKPLFNMEDKEKPLEETGDDKKRFARIKTKKELSDNVKLEKKSNEQLEVLKLSKNINADEIIHDIGSNEDQLRSHILVVDDNLDDNSFKDEILLMLKKAGVDYIIAPDFAEGFYKKATDTGLQLIKCSDTRLIDKGSNINIYFEEGVIFDVDNGQEYKFKLMTDSVRISILRKMRIGECLLISDNSIIKILDIDKDQIKVCVNALKVVSIFLHKSTSIGNEIRIKVLKIILDEADLEIETSEDTTINRK